MRRVLDANHILARVQSINKKGDRRRKRLFGKTKQESLFLASA